MTIAASIQVLGVSLLALSAAAAAAAQEPDRLERLAGVCRDAGGSSVGTYAGRVLWMADGQLSGQLTRDEMADAPETDAESFPVRILTVPRQKPVETAQGLVIHTSVLMVSSSDANIGQSLISCTLESAPTARPDPGATSRG
jgi:hypothetical protein